MELRREGTLASPGLVLSTPDTGRFHPNTFLWLLIDGSDAYKEHPAYQCEIDVISPLSGIDQNVQNEAFQYLFSSSLTVYLDRAQAVYWSPYEFSTVW